MIIYVTRFAKTRSNPAFMKTQILHHGVLIQIVLELQG